MFKKILVLLGLLHAALAFAAVDINSASPADLDSIKGIGPATSKLILKERRKGEFKDWNDLISRVKGVGPKTAAAFSAGGLTVNGAEFSGAAAAPAKAAKEPKAKLAAAPAATGAAPAAGGSSSAVAPIAAKPAAPAMPTASVAPAMPATKPAPASKQ